MRFKVKNVVIMNRPFRQDFVSFFSYTSYNEDQCNSLAEPRELNRYQDGELFYDLLFPPRITNFYGCPVRISGNLVAPLLTFNGDTMNEQHLKDVTRIGGIEGDILRVLADTMNIKLELRFPRDLYGSNASLNLSETFTDVSI